MRFRYQWLVISLGVLQIMVAGSVYGQGMKIYYFSSKYSKEANEQLQRDGLVPAKLMTKSSIDPDGDEKVNNVAVTNYITKNYKDKNASDLCVIDWETKNFKNLRDLDKNNPSFKQAEKEFETVVRIIKSLRPNLKVGIYGIPFRGFYENQRKGNMNAKFDNILSKCDFLAPSYYMMYSDSEVGHNRNTQYLKDNLEIALDYSKRLNRPVIPFMWHKVHSSNKRYGDQLIDKKSFASYIDYIKKYQKSGVKVNAIFWWDWDPKKGQTKQSQITNAFSVKKDAQTKSNNQDNIMLDYVKEVLTTVR